MVQAQEEREQAHPTTLQHTIGFLTVKKNSGAPFESQHMVEGREPYHGPINPANSLAEQTELNHLLTSPAYD